MAAFLESSVSVNAGASTRDEALHRCSNMVHAEDVQEEPEPNTAEDKQEVDPMPEDSDSTPDAPETSLAKSNTTAETQQPADSAIPRARELPPHAAEIRKMQYVNAQYDHTVHHFNWLAEPV